MKQILKIDLYRAFSGSKFLFACLLGLLIGVSNFTQQVWPEFLQMDYYLSLNLNLSPVNVFQKWLGANPQGIEQFLYYLLLPIIAVLPYADSYFSDKKTGYLKNVLIRTSKKDYFTSRYISVFLSGGCAFALPLLINYLISSLFLPSMAPDPYDSSIGETSMWNNVFYKHPIIYTLLFIFLAFLFSGGFATISLTISDFVEHRFLVLVFPFLLYISLFSVGSFVSMNSQMLAWIPMYFLTANFPYSNFYIVLFEFTILIVGTCIGFVWRGIKNDSLC